MTFPKNLAETTEIHIHALVSDGVVESAHLDLKRDLPRLDGAGKHEFLADISAFANSSGGDVIFGIDEDGEGRASRVVAQLANPDEEARRLQDVLMNGVEPRIPGLQVVPVPMAEGGFVLVIRIPQSWAGPHRVKSNNHFYIRENGRKRQIDIPEIRGLFLRSEQQAQKVRDFRTDRLGKLMSGEGPYRLVPGALEVVHLIPTQAALGLVQIDPVPYSIDRQLPALGSTIPCARLNMDGALGIRNPNSQGTHGYSLLFRNGFFEAVKVLTAGGDRGKAGLHGVGYETELINLVKFLREEFGHLGIGEEMTCMLSIIGADEVQLVVNRNRYWPDEHQGHFDRRVLALPDVLLASDISVDRALRPVFDLVWQSAGFLGSGNYAGNGSWMAG